jgi:hypothetical protein
VADSSDPRHVDVLRPSVNRLIRTVRARTPWRLARTRNLQLAFQAFARLEVAYGPVLSGGGGTARPTPGAARPGRDTLSPYANARLDVTATPRMFHVKPLPETVCRILPA